MSQSQDPDASESESSQSEVQELTDVPVVIVDAEEYSYDMVQLASTDDLFRFKQILDTQLRVGRPRIRIWVLNERVPVDASMVRNLRNTLRARAFSDIATEPSNPTSSILSLIKGRHEDNRQRRQPPQKARPPMLDIVIEVRPPIGAGKRIPPQSRASLEAGEEAGDTVGPSSFVRNMGDSYENFLEGLKTAETPSVIAMPSNYLEAQSEYSKIAVLDGRYNPENFQSTVAPPIELYHPVFASFRAKLSDRDLAVPEETLQLTAKLIRKVSGIQKEKARTTDTIELLSEILEGQLSESWDTLRSQPSHMMICTQVHKPYAECPLLTVEEEVELGAGGSEPSVQAVFSYAHYCESSLADEVRDSCCVPCFLLVLAGPWMVITGVVLTQRVIAQRLTDYIWLGNSRVGDQDHVLRVGRALYALSCSLRELRVFYSNLVPQPYHSTIPHPRFFPSITSYPSGNETIEFTYISTLQEDKGCVTFLATLNSGDERGVVVKFVSRYGAEAHRLLADCNLAPALIYYGPITERQDLSYGKYKMVVMDLVKGKTLARQFGHDPLPPEISSTIERALSLLHDSSLVFGDLRRPNVMILDDKEDRDLGSRVRFIDFDWAGKEGEVRYPFHLADSVTRSSGASDHVLITKEHDERMWRKL